MLKHVNNSNGPVFTPSCNKLRIARWNTDKKDEYVDVLKTETVQDNITCLSNNLFKKYML